MPRESSKGVAKFHTDFIIDPSITSGDITELNLMRTDLYNQGLIGQDPKRYGGLAYGNVSQIKKHGPENKSKFIITRTQTSGIEVLEPENFIKVIGYYPKDNRAVAEKTVAEKDPVWPSSEALTHGTMYDMDDGYGKICVIAHAHTPEIWDKAKALRLPTLDETAEYGSYELTEEIRRLFKDDTRIDDMQILSMGGHRDGIITFGETPKEARDAMLHYLSESRKI